MKAISLLSGGLDSILATRLILEQGIEIEGVNFYSVFFLSDAARKAAAVLGIKIKNFDISVDIFEIIKNPKHGYGKNINPCIDCHTLMFKKAGEYMKETGSSFLITGEVLGERPMSQRKEVLELIDKETHLKGLILRPLSAGLLKPTVPEEKGWVDRNRLLAIKGRSRKPQIELAEKFNIKDYPTPAGGCLLTDSGFSNRLRDLMRYKEDFTANDAELLKVGRHFRLNKDAKLIVGRNERENSKLSSLAKDKDLFFYPLKRKGPLAIGRGIFGKEEKEQAASMVARYSDKDTPAALIEVAHKILPSDKIDVIIVRSAQDDFLKEVRV